MNLMLVVEHDTCGQSGNLLFRYNGSGAGFWQNQMFKLFITLQFISEPKAMNDLSANVPFAGESGQSS